jgi:hypothetical protein
MTPADDAVARALREAENALWNGGSAADTIRAFLLAMNQHNRRAGYNLACEVKEVAAAVTRAAQDGGAGDE